MTTAVLTARMTKSAFGTPYSILLGAEAREDVETASTLPLWRRISRRYFLRRLDGALAIAASKVDYWVRLGLHRSKAGVVRSSADPSFRPPTELEAQEVNSKLAVDPSDLVMIFAGRLIPLKNPRTVLETALETAHKLGCPCHLIFAGSGPEASLCREHTPHLRIHCMGEVGPEELLSLLWAFNVLLLPFTRETWSLGVMKAMNCGVVPVVSSTLGAAAGLVQLDVTGAVFPLPQFAASASDWITSHAVALQEHGKGGLSAHVQERIASWDNTVSVTDFCETMVAHGVA